MSDLYIAHLIIHQPNQTEIDSFTYVDTLEHLKKRCEWWRASFAHSQQDQFDGLFTGDTTSLDHTADDGTVASVILLELAPYLRERKETEETEEIKIRKF
mgnify:FL=1